MANADLIKKLRENTGCGMSDCNKALNENADDYDKAVEWLRKKGLSSAAKKSARVAAEGVVGIKNTENIATIVEVNSETDFVARNEKFQAFVNSIMFPALKIQEKDSEKFAECLKDEKCEGSSEKIADTLVNNIATIGENLKIRRGKTIALHGNGLIVDYVHSAVAPGLGKIGVLVALLSDAPQDKLEELGKGIAMHIAASKPEFLKEKEVPQSKIDSEKSIAKEKAKQSGKPDNIIEKMVEGSVKKYFEESVLLDQSYVMDPSKKISDVLKDFEKANGTSIEIQEFVLFILGEGIEKKTMDFAEEVASITGGTK
ncbi:MAG: elongation factor Ts [Crenarchaeota archaeon]|nr:elongation factor Ts [Thermoproteota archaeon]